MITSISSTLMQMNMDADTAVSKVMPLFWKPLWGGVAKRKLTRFRGVRYLSSMAVPVVKHRVYLTVFFYAGT